MLQELVARTGAGVWAVASMLFFIGVWTWIAVGVFRARPEDMTARARMALDGDERSADAAQGSGTKA
jgi:hypothetical protein